jgi:hypothetical protein
VQGASFPSLQKSDFSVGSGPQSAVAHVSVVGSVGVLVLGAAHVFPPQLFAQHFRLSLQEASLSQVELQLTASPPGTVLGSGQSPGLTSNGVLQDVPPQGSPQHFMVPSHCVSRSQFCLPIAIQVIEVSTLGQKPAFGT